MAESRLYEDIALRTGGDIYVGVVGPVRTGKSTFIKKFMETLIIPGIENTYVRERARDELPQSGSGRTVMTAEPKFVPEEAVSVRLGGAAQLSVRLVDCVGYMVSGAAGNMEDGAERLVATPWFEEEIGFARAAEEGTRRVIRDHSTVGLMVTTDGSVCGIPREEYIPAEERVIAELKAIGKPFLVLLNCVSPASPEAAALAAELSERHGVQCLPVNCLELREADIRSILEELLSEFSAEEYSVFLPQWAAALPMDHELKRRLFEELGCAGSGLCRLRDAENLCRNLRELDFISSAEVCDMRPGTGSFCVRLELPRELYYHTLSTESGLGISSDADLILTLRELAEIKRRYDKVEQALMDVNERGYGVVLPSTDEMVLQEPEIVRAGGKYKVVLRAGAPAIHMLKTDVETEVSPAVGGENASQEILSFLLQSFEGDAGKLWESNIFGKSMYDIAGEGLSAKLRRMPEETAQKLRGAMQRIINEGSGGLICIIL